MQIPQSVVSAVFGYWMKHGSYNIRFAALNFFQNFEFADMVI